ncbi:MAG: hypothetical protein ACTSWW_10485 [Promethearchaeota archaeon]
MMSLRTSPSPLKRIIALGVFLAACRTNIGFKHIPQVDSKMYW